MESGLNLVYGEQRYAVLVRRGEVCNVADDGAHFLAVSVVILVADVVHPGAAPLAGAREIVAGEDSHKVAVSVRHLVGEHFGIVFRDIRNLFYVYAVKNLGRQEHSLAHVVHLKVRLGHVLVQVVFLLAHFL